MTSKKVLNFNKRSLQDTSCLEQSAHHCDCGDVEEIYLCFNYISELPQTILSLYSNLTHLSVGCNKLTVIPPHLSTCCPQLRCLRAPNNQLTTVPDLRGVDNLECLDLRYNHMTTLDNLLPLSNLREFSASDNKIHTICWSQVPVFPQLSFLGIYGNQLNDFEEIIHGLSDRTQNLKYLNVGSNPFCRDRQLSLVSTLLTLKHLSLKQVRKLFLALGEIYASVADENSQKTLKDLEVEVDACFADFSCGQDTTSLKRVANILLRLKATFPHLERVDEDSLPSP